MWTLLLNLCLDRFKPCYKWNAFNTSLSSLDRHGVVCVLNLVITGMPSILNKMIVTKETIMRF